MRTIQSITTFGEIILLKLIFKAKSKGVKYRPIQLVQNKAKWQEFETAAMNLHSLATTGNYLASEITINCIFKSIDLFSANGHSSTMGRLPLA
jgi:hypothetical protein